MDKTDEKCGNKRPRVVGQGVFVSKSGYTCINQGLASSRRVNTGIMSSTHVTGDIGYQPTKGLKWKNLRAVTQRKLQVQTRSKLLELGQGYNYKGNLQQQQRVPRQRLHQRKMQREREKVLLLVVVSC
ncbi:hypothetical protein P3S67_018211 [Capsicum chacoense]